MSIFENEIKNRTIKLKLTLYKAINNLTEGEDREILQDIIRNIERMPPEEVAERIEMVEKKYIKISVSIMLFKEFLMEMGKRHGQKY